MGRRGEFDEGLEVFRSADRVRVEAGRGWHADRRGVSQGWDFRCDLLQLTQKYAGLIPSEMKRLRQLEEENAKLKRTVADLSLDKAMLQDVLSKKL
jgi:hypothetical protein